MNHQEKYLKSLSDQYPSIAEASTEIINLSSILNLPKGTEHFVSDIHGEYGQFMHILHNGSGAIRRKINDVYGRTLSKKDKKQLATLIYYPEQKLKLVKEEGENMDDWYRVTLNRLIHIAAKSASKYTRSKVRKALPKDYAYVLEELIYEKEGVYDKEEYYSEILATIIRIGRADHFIVALGNLIQRLVIDHLHIVGDIFDRGSSPHLIMDMLMKYHSVDIQWGNHDVLWMGAASGHPACIANVLRLSARYGNLDTLEEGYGINLIPLASFALKQYEEDECKVFDIHYDEATYNAHDLELDRKMHKAIAIIQFKLEGQLIKRRPEFNMDSRLLLDKIDYENGSILVNGVNYPLNDTNFPTINPDDPYALTVEEEEVMKRIRQSFLNCEKLQEHVRFLFTHGSLYLRFNSNLLYHGCVPLNEDGSFRKVYIGEKAYTGKALYDILEQHARIGYYAQGDEEKKLLGQDMMWYIWSSEDSPVYGKEKMATFERYFVDDKNLQEERKDYYYQLIEREDVVERILLDFGMDKDQSHIINGHMPVELKKGETPVKCNGRALIIDGGFSKAYRGKTGIAGYTLIYNSWGLRLVSHEPYSSIEDVVAQESDIHSEFIVVEQVHRRKKVADTDSGKVLKEKIKDLEVLLEAYKDGTLKER